MKSTVDILSDECELKIKLSEEQLKQLAELIVELLRNK